jgi:hypothetical protein
MHVQTNLKAGGIKLLASLLGPLWSRRRRRARRRAPHFPRLSFCPRLLSLDDRTLPSTFVVTNLLDSVAGSLRQAVLDANAHPGPDDIAFAPGLQGTIALTSGQLDITDGLTIHGPGAGRVTVSGTDHSRVFGIAGGVAVTLAELTVAHGQAAMGGGIDNAGDLTISNGTLSQNQSVNGLGGGAILNEVGASLTRSAPPVQWPCGHVTQKKGPKLWTGTDLRRRGNMATGQVAGRSGTWTVKATHRGPPRRASPEQVPKKADWCNNPLRMALFYQSVGPPDLSGRRNRPCRPFPHPLRRRSALAAAPSLC